MMTLPSKALGEWMSQKGPLATVQYHLDALYIMAHGWVRRIGMRHGYPEASGQSSHGHDCTGRCCDRIFITP